MSEAPEEPVYAAPQLLPDTGWVLFLATTSDPRPDHPHTVYGAGHITAYVVEDKEFIASCILDGKLCLTSQPAA